MDLFATRYYSAILEVFKYCGEHTWIEPQAWGNGTLNCCASALFGWHVDGVAKALILLVVSRRARHVACEGNVKSLWEHGIGQMICCG